MCLVEIETDAGLVGLGEAKVAVGNLGNYAGIVALIREEPDAMIARIVDSWPRAFDARRAVSLGFAAEADFDQIVGAHVEDELGTRPGVAENPA